MEEATQKRSMTAAQYVMGISDTRPPSSSAPVQLFCVVANSFASGVFHLIWGIRTMLFMSSEPVLERRPWLSHQRTFSLGSTWG